MMKKNSASLCKHVSLILSIAVLICAAPAGAETVLGTPFIVNAGNDQFGTARGNEQAPVTGNTATNPTVIGDLVGQGGNAITVCVANALAPAIDEFQMTSTNCAGCGLQIVPISATNGLGVCDDITGDPDFDQACNDRGNSTCDGNNPGRLMDIAGPVFSTTTDWRFLGGAVPASATYVEITGLTDVLAAEVDFFSLNVDGTLIQSGPFGFGTVDNGAELAVAIGSLSGLISTSYNASTDVLRITRTVTGPVSFSGLRLEQTTAATKTEWRFVGFTDSEAGATNKFTMKIDGNPVNQSAVNLLAATNLATLAAELDKINGIDAFMTNTSCCLHVRASNVGGRVFSELAVIATPPQVTNVDSIANTGNGSVSEGENVAVAITQFILEFDSTVQDPAGDTIEKDVTNPANYLLVEHGLNNTRDTVNCLGGVQADDIETAVSGVAYDLVNSVATVTLGLGGASFLGPGNFSLFACGTTSIVDVVGQELDGNGDGTEGDDFIRSFSIPDADGDGDPDFNDPDDDNDGVPDINDDFPFDPTETNDNDNDGVGDNADQDDDNDGIGDGLDTNPTVADNACDGTNVTFDESEIVGPTTCAAANAITVEPMPGQLVEVLATGDLKLIAPAISFKSGFTVLENGLLKVLAENPCPGC